MGVSGYLVLKRRAAEPMRKTLKLAVVFGLIVALFSLFPTGHHHAKQVAHTQPEKFAAMEGLIRAHASAPMVLFGKPSEKPPKMDFVIGIPGMLSWLAFGDANAPIMGMEDLQKAGHPTPPFVITFVSFHTMVGLGMIFILLTGWGTFLLARKKLFESHWYLKLLPWVIPLPLLACQLGWIVAEVGRQPWVVYRVLKTQDAYSANITGGEVLTSIIMFGLIYLFLGALYLYVLFRIARRGPQPLTAKEVH